MADTLFIRMDTVMTRELPSQVVDRSVGMIM